MQEKVQLTKKDRIHVWLRSTFLQGSWNYERMQNGGWAYIDPSPQEVIQD